MRVLSHPLAVTVGGHGGVPMGGLTARGWHVLETWKRPCGACGPHDFLYLFRDLLYYGVGHGGHEVLECVHHDVGLPPSRGQAD